jgi:hypothetical protein
LSQIAAAGCGRIPRASGVIAKILGMVCKRNNSPDERLRQIVGNSIGCRPLREAAEDPAFLPSIYRRVDQLGEEPVLDVLKRYLAEY